MKQQFLSGEQVSIKSVKLDTYTSIPDASDGEVGELRYVVVNSVSVLYLKTESTTWSTISLS
jgi:hypothetical protein